MKTFRWITLILALLCIGSKSFAVDKGIYWGVWKCEIKGLTLLLDIEKEVKVRINGKELKDLEVSYMYGKNAAYPFLFISSTEEMQNDPKYIMHEYSIYLIIGHYKKSQVKQPKMILRGFYEFSKVKNDHYGTVEDTLYPIELAKIADK